MTATPEELTELLAHHRIRACVVRLARGEDRRSAELVAAAFWPEAAVDFGIFAGSFEDYLGWVVPGSSAVLLTQHLLGQTLIEVDGATARTETHVVAYHRIDLGTEQRDTVLGGRYLDRFEERGGEWRIAHRTMLYDFAQDLGVSADFSQGLMGTPFSGDHFTGRTTDDHSVRFFAPEGASDR